MAAEPPPDSISPEPPNPLHCDKTLKNLKVVFHLIIQHVWLEGQADLFSSQPPSLNLAYKCELGVKYIESENQEM